MTTALLSYTTSGDTTRLRPATFISPSNSDQVNHGQAARTSPFFNSLLERLYQRLERERYEIGRLGAWVHDFQIEMQMLLLGELFPDPVERRDPPDSEQFCVRLDRFDQIERRINESPWGVKAAEIEASAWAKISNGQRREAK